MCVGERDSNEEETVPKLEGTFLLTVFLNTLIRHAYKRDPSGNVSGSTQTILWDQWAYDHTNFEELKERVDWSDRVSNSGQLVRG